MGLVDEALKQENERLRRENEQLRQEKQQLKPRLATVTGLTNGSQATDVVTTITLKPGCKITIEYP